MEPVSSCGQENHALPEGAVLTSSRVALPAGRFAVTYSRSQPSAALSVWKAAVVSVTGRLS